ncbi:MAG TPA: 50S ribosomal protein L24 [Planctomycetaceae bacterium]|nr:50S ribosomal protein L24 [Planctomycetaceae bacterium]HIQ22375.1 50S ribosomal protein L24 [Planctomycetota bacterium]
MWIRRNDMVQIISGDDKGARGKVLSVDRQAGKVVVEGVNLVWKHVRRSQRNPQGGRLHKEMPIDLSNVALIDPVTNEPTRVGVRYLEDGTKERYSKKSGASLGVISRPKSRRAKSSQ